MIRPIILFAGLLIALPVHANERPTSERVTDGLGFVATSGLLMMGAGMAGAYLGRESCSDEDRKQFLGCAGPAILGMGIGGLTGLVGGGLLFDGLSDGDGSLWGAAGGLAVGTLAGIGWGAVTERDGVQWLGGLTLALAGMGAGYALFDATSVTPTASIVPDGTGGTRSSFGLSGRF